MANWVNRIVDSGEESPDQLLSNPRNWRIHPKSQQDALSAVLDNVGWVQHVVVNRSTGFVVDGHLRVALAISKGEPSIPVVYVDLTEEEEALVLAALDTVSHMGVPDEEALATLLDDIKSSDEALTGLAELFADEMGLVDKVTKKSNEPEVKISPELYERHDYLLFYFDNDFDWQAACAAFDVQTVECAPVKGKSMYQKGIGRVISGKDLLGKVLKE